MSANVNSKENIILCGDCEEVLLEFPDNYVDLIVTSPPYADSRKNTYGGIHPDKFVSWFLPKSREFLRVIKPTGTFILNIKEKYEKVEAAKRNCSGLAKRLKYAMSHESGKIEIIAIDKRHIYLKYHRAKDSKDDNRMIICHRDDNAHWFDDLRPLPDFRQEFYELKAQAVG